MKGANGYLLLDQGSHASRALVTDDAGRIRLSTSLAVETTRPRPGWVEHDAAHLLQTVRDVVQSVVTQAGPANLSLVGAGLATQRSTVVCWDAETGEPLSPAISWQDRRQAKWLTDLGLDFETVHRVTGLVPSPHYGASKLRWCLDHLPPVAAALEAGRLRWGPLSSFLLHGLLDETPHLVDPANASRTLLWDIDAGDWSDRMLSCFDLPRAPLPRCTTSRSDFGTLTLGDLRLPLSVCTGDQAAALFAGGWPEADILHVNIGTGAFVQRVSDTPVAAPGLLRSVVWSDADRTLFVLEGTVNGAGAALTWLAGDRGIPVARLREELPDWLEAENDPPVFINGVGGLGSPFWRADVQPAFEASARLPAATVAVIESIVFLLMVNIDAMNRALGPPRRIEAGGGLARLDGLCQRLADLAGVPVFRPAETEATAAGLGCLLRNDRAPTAGPATRFDPGHPCRLADRFARFKKLLPPPCVLHRPGPS